MENRTKLFAGVLVAAIAIGGGYYAFGNNSELFKGNYFALDQIKEIESEIWIQGERGNHDREQIAAEWTQRHARSWREWRIKEYLFAVERMDSRLAECLELAS